MSKHLELNELIKYEMPTWYTFVSINWLQTILSKRLGRKVSRKLKRYKSRMAMAERVKAYSTTKDEEEV